MPTPEVAYSARLGGHFDRARPALYQFRQRDRRPSGLTSAAPDLADVSRSVAPHSDRTVVASAAWGGAQVGRGDDDKVRTG